MPAWLDNADERLDFVRRECYGGMQAFYEDVITFEQSDSSYQ
jgi:hypothetical protein